MNHLITLEQAIQMTATFRENKNKVLSDQFHGLDIIPNAETFDKAAFEKLFSQPSCEKLRVYYGMDADLRVHAIFVGADIEGRDILSASSTVLATEDGTILTTESGDMFATEETDIIIEAGQRCPPGCIESPLNP